MEIYRASNTEVEAYEDTRVETIDIGSNEEHTFVDAIDNDHCDRTPYYAVRALDSAGNPSSVRPENDVTITKTAETENTSISAINITTTTNTPTSESSMLHKELNINDFGL